MTGFNLGDAYEKGLGSMLLFLLINTAVAAGSIPKIVTFYLKKPQTTIQLSH